METFDVVVIGAGPGGYPAAIRVAQLGASVAVIEKEHAGGTCLNWGCIPTKCLIAGAEVFDHVRRAGEFGVRAAAPSADYAAMAARKNEVVGRLRRGVEQLLKAHGVSVFPGAASFRARNRLRVAGPGGEAEIGARAVIVATGSVSALPAFLPRHPRVTDSRAFLDLERLPASLLVLGGGVIGCEFACMAARLGSKVTVVELLEDILLILDPEIRRELRRRMEAAGVRVLAGHPLDEIEAADTGVAGTCNGERLEADALLAAVGRRPVTDGLDLAAAGLSVNAAGFLDVDAFGATAAAGIYAVGDVTGGPQLAHAATSQGLTVAENLCLKTRRPVETLVPSCIFTAPEVATVGLSSEQARAAGREVQTGSFGFTALGRALCAGENHGLVKWIADPGTGRLLGAQAVGPHATELIAEATLAIRAEMTWRELAHTVHAHPTFAEAWMEAAHALGGACVHAPPKRR